jgi:hypothetical protein
VVARQTTWREFPSLWGSMLDEVYAVVKPANADRAGRGEERWQNVMLYKDDVPNVEVGVLASGPISDAGKVISSALPAGVTAALTHRGPYAKLDLAHRAVRDWCAAHGRNSRVRAGRYTGTGARIRVIWRPRSTTSSAELHG